MQKMFFSFPVTIILLFLYALSCAIATFIENDFTTASAKALVYNAIWFDVLHILLGINLVGILFFSKMWKNKKYASLLLHLSLLMILIGAGITRYFGIEGGMHIREGESSDTIVTREEYFKVFLADRDDTFSFPVNFAPLRQKHFSKDIELAGSKFHLQSLEYIPAEDSISTPNLKVALTYLGETKEVVVPLNYNGNITPVGIGDELFGLRWGPEEIKIPFSIKLHKFILDRYAGSMSPSSFASEIEVLDSQNGVVMPYKIFMNNVLDYGGYRFFQSSYDTDEKGTILSVNKDPGKLPTYIGYTMLIFGFLWIYFSRETRFFKIKKYLKAQNFLCALLLLYCFNTPALASEHQDDLKENQIEKIKDETEVLLTIIDDIKKNSESHMKKFASLLVQDFGGRIKPIDTVSMEFIHKITKKDRFLGLDFNQLFLAMMIYPDRFKQVKMIPVKTQKLKEILGVSVKQKYIAFNDVFTQDTYKLINYAADASRKKPDQRDQFDKDVLAVDERINIAYYIYSGRALRIFPDMTRKSLAWYSPADTLPFSEQEIQHLKILLGEYFFTFHHAIKNNNWVDCDNALSVLKRLQEIYGEDLIPSSNHIKLEIILNHYNIFSNLISVYIILGIILFIGVFYQILRNSPQKYSFFFKVIYIFIAVVGLLHTLGLVARWYVGEHAPWSNAYESMIYISWATCMAGIFFFRKSYLTLGVSSLLAGIILFVAHLGFMDPQIGNLVPVLKSYWLNIHVSVITASYGFFGICFMLGCASLVLFMLRNKKRKNIDQSILNLHYVNEMSMMLGLGMLTIGNFLGGVWANESWGRYWGWDSKETWALISIVVYSIVLHLRFISRFNSPFVFATASLLAFYAILMTYFGVNFYLSGLHSYASGEVPRIPIFLYFFVVITIGLIFGAYFKRKLPAPDL